MFLSLIGMSGIGKSLLASRLAEFGFSCLCCDELIAQRLSDEIGNDAESHSTLGEWMGFPYDPLYQEREDRYLELEKEVLEQILGTLSDQLRPLADVVIDTTGSAIYVGDPLLSKLAEVSTIVHLATPPVARERMLQAYISNKRPVLWRGIYKKFPEEPPEKALARCFATLLETRETLYAKYAHITFDGDALRNHTTTSGDFLRTVRE